MLMRTREPYLLSTIVKWGHSSGRLHGSLETLNAAMISVLYLKALTTAR